jgi:signal transduction histidine kinase
VLLLAWISILLVGTVTEVVAVGLLIVFFAMPVGTVVGVLRHDLYDIDRLLSRTVSYTLLTAALSGVFAAIVLIGGVAAGRGATLPVALATLACAVAFGPLRRRLQATVDRRFDRDRGRAMTAVARFVDAVRDGMVMAEQVDVALREALADPAVMVAYAIDAPGGDTTWLDGTGRRIPRPDEPRHELAPGGRLVATIGYGPAAAARTGLVRDLVREVQLPLEVARARIEVRLALAETEASRARLVQVGYEERRRLERDLHDGAQQRLVAVGMALRLAQRHLPDSSTHEALNGAVADLQAAVAELRRISQGLRPSGLDDGLSSALRTLVRSSPVPVELHVTTVSVHDTVATTAYYVAAEAVANALKHAQPRQVRIEVSHDDEQLTVSVADDGCGGAVIVPGSGLAGLVDRVSAGGGTLQVRSVLGGGTTVKALLPCAS